MAKGDEEYRGCSVTRAGHRRIWKVEESEGTGLADLWGRVLSMVGIADANTLRWEKFCIIGER